MIKVENMTFGYNKKNLFENINLSAEWGHVYGLFGKNGEGKTTLLRLLSGLLFPKEGNISVMGMTPMERKPDFLRSVFFLEENPILPNISIGDFANYYGIFYPQFSKKSFGRYLKAFEVENEKKKISQLSHGTQKKVLIAFAIATNTQVLYMDEPTNGLDIPSKKIFREIVFSNEVDDKIIFISTHQVRDLHALIDSIIILQENKILFSKTLEQIQEKLLFHTIDRREISANTLYFEETLKAYFAIEENKKNRASEVNIELLFNAVTQDPSLICNILNA